jgi:hypothetical protein
MRNRPRHGPRARLTLTLAALGALLVGYYVGQYWQRQPLEALSAVVFEDGKPIEYPASLDLAATDATAAWRLFLTADTRVEACATALRRFALMMNRLAAWPKIQSRVRLTVLAHDEPSAEQTLAFDAGATWIDVVSAPRADLERLTGALGILPDRKRWCAPTQLNSMLVAPNGQRWALIPYEDPETMAYNVQAVIQFVE